MSEQEVPDLFDTDNVIVCQYDKVFQLLNNQFIFSRSSYRSSAAINVSMCGAKNCIFKEMNLNKGFTSWHYAVPIVLWDSFLLFMYFLPLFR